MDCRERILSDLYADLIIDFTPPVADVFSGQTEDYCVIPVGNYNLLYVNRFEVPDLSEDFYLYGNTPNIYGLMQNEFDPVSLFVSGITQVQRPPLSLTGRGTLIAFIDTGIDYTLDIFRDAGGESRIFSIWDQEIQSGVPPEGFFYGSEYTREQINAALRSDNPYEIVPSRDELRHGTSMAGVAAGSSIDGGRTYLGAAPDADIVVVKLKQCKPYLRRLFQIPEDVPAYSENDVMLGIKYAQSFGIVFQRPVIICLGIGTSQGNHAGTSPLARYLNQVAAMRSRAVVVGGGNEGNAAHHFSGKLRNGSNDSDNYLNAEIRVGEGVQGFVAEFWGNVTDVFNLSIRSPGGETILPTWSRWRRRDQNFGFVFENTRITVSSILVEQNTGEELIVLRFEAPTEGIWNLRIFAQGEVYNGNFNIWLPISQFITGEVYFLQPDPYTTMTEPAYAQNVITVSSYNDQNNSFYQESGRGFAKDGNVKPDFAAPGVNISTVFGPVTGSSMAVAITAGAVAQFLQWAVVERKSVIVEGVEVKSYFIRGASRSGEIMYPTPTWGFGRLDIAGVFETLARV